MSYYGDRPPTRTRPIDTTDYAYVSHKPVTKRVGAGRRARIAVETGGDDTRYQQQHEVEEAIKRETQAARLAELKRRKGGWESRTRGRDYVVEPRQRLERRDSFRRRNSLPIRTSYTSPEGRHGRPGTDIPFGGSVVEDSAPLDSSDEDGDKFDFILPKPSGGLRIAEAVTFELSESADDGAVDEPIQSGKGHFTGPIVELSILQSRWVGSSAERGELGGEIVTIPSTVDASEKQLVESIKWYHLERFMMNFEDFTAASLSVLQLSERTQRDVSKLLRDVQKRFEKQRHHGRDMEADCIGDFFLNNSTSRARQTASVIFLSFPYFSLDPYSSAPIKALAPGSPLHPLRPILQAEFYATSRQRELAQVITRMPGTPEGECLHLSQIWCLLINGNTMITCSRLPLDVLRGETIKQTSVSSPSKRAHMKVWAYNNRSWRVPVSNGMSWPAFLALFEDLLSELEHYGSTIQFEDQYGVVDGARWPDLIDKALLGSFVELQMKNVHLTHHDAAMQTADENAESSSNEDVSLGTHTPQRLDSDAAASTAERDAPKMFGKIKPAATLPLEMSHTLQLFKHAGSTTYMRSLADNFHTVLRSNSRSGEKNAYKKCPGAKAADIESWLTLNEHKSLDDSETRDSLSLKKYKRRLASSSKYLFCLFWPPEFEHSMSDKYWGAIYQILSRESEFFDKGHRDPKTDVVEAAAMHYVMQHEIIPNALTLVREFLTYEGDLRPLPEAFSKAWLHTIMAFVMAAETTSSRKVSFSHSSVSKHLHAVVDEFSKAKRELAARLRKADLEDLEVCDENSLLTMLINRLARDNMRGRPDVARAYGDYFQNLDFNVTQDPVPRAHQETIRFFLQEVEAILTTLQNQMSVIDGVEKSLEQQSEDIDPLFEDALGESRQALVIESCKAWIGGRIDKFKGLQQRALELGEWHRNEMDTNKDRQEKAILVFTIVTIIFLPLSFVAGVFGMNTTDIRDMPYKSWLYWAAGIPLTVVVVVISLWFAGELESLGRWIARSMSRSKAPSSGYEDFQGQKLETYELTSRRRQGLRTRTQEDDLEDRPLRIKRRTTYPIKDG